MYRLPIIFEGDAGANVTVCHEVKRKKTVTFQTPESTIIIIVLGGHSPHIHEPAIGKLTATAVGERDDRGRRRTERLCGTDRDVCRLGAQARGTSQWSPATETARPSSQTSAAVWSGRGAIQDTNGSTERAVPAWTPPTCDVVERCRRVMTVRL